MDYNSKNTISILKAIKIFINQINAMYLMKPYFQSYRRSKQTKEVSTNNHIENFI